MLADRVRMGAGGKEEFKDIWGSPGNTELIAGNKKEKQRGNKTTLVRLVEQSTMAPSGIN